MSIEKELTQTVAPIVDELVDQSKRIESLESREVKDGKDADSTEIVERLKSDDEFIAKTKAHDLEADQVADVIKSDESFVESLKGKDGQSVDKAVVIDELKADQSFVEQLKAKDGIDGLGHNVEKWSQKIYREGAIVQFAAGKFYQATKDTNEAPRAGDDWQRVGTGGFEWTGLKSERDYEDGDIYIDGGSAFIYWGEKGHMLCQRGKPGQKGEKGGDGDDGQDAATIVAAKFDDEAFHLALSDGNVVSADIEYLNEYIYQKALTFLEAAIEVPEYATPIKTYRGTWSLNDSYSVGDVVTLQKATWLCHTAAPKGADLIADYWVKLASNGAGGGGGGGGGGWNYIATRNINMAGHLISSIAPPRGGTIGQLDAVNRDTMEKAIAAGALYQGIYTVATNSPNLQAKADAAFTHPAAGSTIAKPNPAASDVTDVANILTWHNWGGHGFDTFAVTTTAPTPFEVRLSNGLIHKFNIPPAAYGDEAALKAALDAQAAAIGVVSFEVYVNGADCHIGVETAAPLYCTAIGGETGNAFPIATEGAGNTILNTYNWVVQTRDENKPEALPGGIVGLPAGTVVKNSDVLQWSTAIHGFEIISGSSLTQSFSDNRYWQINGNNMRWEDQAYNKGSIVYSESRNSWFVATQNIVAGSPEPGLLAAGAMWRKINSSYGSTVFFGRGPFDESDTSALNNWGMPPQTYPSGQQPLNGDTYFDVLSGSTTDFTVTQHPPEFVLRGTFNEATGDLGYQFWGAGLYHIQDWPVGAPAVPPAIGSGWHGTTTTLPLTITGGTFAGETIAMNSHYFVIWSGDPDADHDGWVLLQRPTAPVPAPAGWNDWTIATPHPQNKPDTVAGLTVYGFERNVEIPISVGATVGLDIMLAKNLPNTSWRMTGELIDLDDGTICEFFVTNIAGSNKPEITPVNILPAANPGIDEIIVHHSTASGIFITGKLNAHGRGRTYKLELTTEDFDLGVVIHGDGVEHEGGRTSSFYALSKYPAQLIPMQLIGAKASNADFSRGTMLRIPANVIAGHIYQVAAVVRGTYDNESDYFVTQLGISINGGNTIAHNKTFSVNKTGWYESTINSMDIWKATVTGPVEFDLTCISYSGGVQFRSTNMTVIDMGTG